MRTSALFICSSLVLLASPAAAEAPSVLAAHVEGQVTVLSAHGSFTAETGSLISPLSRVVVPAKASVNLMVDGCAVILEGAAIYTLPATAPCAPGENIVIRDNVVITPAADLAGMDGNDGYSVPPPPPPVYAPAAGYAPTAVVVGVVTTIGLASAAALASSVLSDEEEPATPN